MKIEKVNKKNEIVIYSRNQKVKIVGYRFEVEE